MAEGYISHIILTTRIQIRFSFARSAKKKGHKGEAMKAAALKFAAKKEYAKLVDTR